MKTFKGYGFFVLMLLVLALVFIANEYFINSNRDNYSVTQFKQDIMEEKIQSVEVRQNAEVPTGELTAKYSNGEKRVYVSDVNQILQFLDEKNFTQVRVGDVARTPWYLEVLPYIIGVVLILLLFSMMSSNANGGGGGGKMMNFGKSRAKLTMPDDKVKTFQDVAGLVEEKEQLEEIVDFLSAPGKYTKLGARIPKGVIMVGPPGTGKTLPGRPVFRFSAFPVLILWKCLSV